MDIKELIREKIFAEIIAERDAIILSQHEQIGTMEKELATLRKEIEVLKKSEG